MADDLRKAALAELARRELARRGAESGESQSKAAGALDSFTQGAAFGFGDELTALEAGIMGRTPDGGWFDYSQSFGDRYDAALNAERGQQKQFAADNPVLATGAEIAGGVATAMTPVGAVGQAVGKPLTAANLARSAGAGAGYGAAYGFGEGEGGAVNRAANVPVNAAIGAAGGVAGNVLQAGVGRVMQGMSGDPVARQARQMGVMPETYRIARDLAQNADADIAGGAARFIRQGGPEAMVGDVMPGPLDAVTNVGAGAPIARRNLNARVDQASRDVARATNKALGEARGRNEITREIMDGTSGNRANAYAAAYDAPVDYSRPSGKKIEELLSRMDGDELRKAVREARADMRLDGVNRQQFKFNIGDDGGIAIEEMPSVMELDYLKRHLDNVAAWDSPPHAVTGEARRARKISRNLRGLLIENNDNYAEALKAGKDAITQRQGREIGAKLLDNGTYVEDIAEMIQRTDWPDWQRMKQGLRSEMAHRLGNVRRVRSDPNTDQRAAWKNIADVLTDNNKEKLRLVLGNAEAQKYFDELETAARSFNVRAGAAANSSTAGRGAFDRMAQDAANRGRVPERLPRSVLDEVLSLPVRGFNVLRGATPGKIAGRRSKIDREMAELLTGAKGDDALALIAQLLAKPPASPPGYKGPVPQMLARQSRLLAAPLVAQLMQP